MGELIGDSLSRRAMLVGLTGAIVGSSGCQLIQGPTVVENFENGDLSAYYGDPDFHVTQDRTFDGRYALASQNDRRSQGILTTNQSGAPVQRGDTFSCRVYAGDRFGRPGFRFFADESGRGYTAIVEGPDANLELRRVDGVNDSGPILATDSIENFTGQWCVFEVESTSKRLSVDLYDSEGVRLGSVTVTDSTRNGPGIGFDQNRVQQTSIDFLDYVTKGPAQS